VRLEVLAPTHSRLRAAVVQFTSPHLEASRAAAARVLTPTARQCESDRGEGLEPRCLHVSRSHRGRCHRGCRSRRSIRAASPYSWHLAKVRRMAMRLNPAPLSGAARPDVTERGTQHRVTRARSRLSQSRGGDITGEYAIVSYRKTKTDLLKETALLYCRRLIFTDSNTSATVRKRYVCRSRLASRV
jgi:hypothetical protein